MKTLVTFLLLTLSQALACPSETSAPEPQTTLPPLNQIGEHYGEQGNPCLAENLCNEGLICVSGFCVLAEPVRDAGVAAITDAGLSPSATNPEDAGMSNPTLPLDAGSQITFDAGQSVIDAGPPPEPIIPWLLSVNNTTHKLLKIDVATGNWVALCELNTTDNYHSTTFGFDGTLFASNTTDQTLDVIDPCTCDISLVGAHNQGNIPGITANGDKIEKLFGLSTTYDILVSLEIATGAGTEVGPLGMDFQNCGTTWSREINGLYSINSVDRNLHNLNPLTGHATPIVQLDIDIGAVGIEWHPSNEKLYLCTNPLSTSYLYEVSTTTGITTPIASFPDRCTNLAAPWVPVACVDDVVIE